MKVMFDYENYIWKLYAISADYVVQSTSFFTLNSLHSLSLAGVAVPSARVYQVASAFS